MPQQTKKTREQKLADRAARKAARAQKQAQKEAKETLLTDDEKVQVRKACMKVSHRLNERSDVINTICDMPKGTTSNQVKTFMESKHIKKSVIDTVVNLFVTFENKKVK